MKSDLKKSKKLITHGRSRGEPGHTHADGTGVQHADQSRAPGRPTDSRKTPPAPEDDIEYGAPVHEPAGN